MYCYNKRILKIIIIVGGFYIIAALSPLAVDDYYFMNLQFNSFSERISYVLHYGNGRLLGNLLVLYALQMPLLRYLLKTFIFFMLGIYMTKIVDCAVSGNNENIVFLLLLTLIPQIFAQVYSWTSGFCNYVIPVLCFIYLIYKFFFSDKEMDWKSEIMVFWIGGGVNCL